MKQLIDSHDVRRGDLIRYEFDTERWDRGRGRAYEYVATKDREPAYEVAIKGGRHYLLDHPAPAVELPTVPTLGWATWGDRADLAVWVSRHVPDTLRPVDSSGENGGDLDGVTAFTPATAVPTVELDALRALLDRTYKLEFEMPVSLVYEFLAAVDTAGDTK